MRAGSYSDAVSDSCSVLTFLLELPIQSLVLRELGNRFEININMIIFEKCCDQLERHEVVSGISRANRFSPCSTGLWIESPLWPTFLASMLIFVQGLKRFFGGMEMSGLEIPPGISQEI